MWHFFLKKRNRSDLKIPNLADVTIIAIAKDEASYIKEWIAHHLAIGVGNFILYDNDSSDGTGTILRRIATKVPHLRVVDWPSIEGKSPQRSAYNHGLRLVQTEWVSFIDIDEFLVPWRDGSLQAYLDNAADDVSAIHLNWRGFGSNGFKTSGYDYVTTTFTRASYQNWGNNYHYKMIGRAKKISEMHIHYADVATGRCVLSDFSDLDIVGTGQSGKVIHDGIQINHYQCKTFDEFRLRMQRGNVNYPIGHPEKDTLDASQNRFNDLDRNEEEDTKISQFYCAMQYYYKLIY